MLSETCEFYGVSGSLDTSMADALLSGGAKAVAGYVNNVYTVYSRSMLWATVNRLIWARPCRRPLSTALDTYGADDLVWYNAQGGTASPCGGVLTRYCSATCWGPAQRTARRGTCHSSRPCRRLSVALLHDLYYTRGWQKLLPSLF